jgi:hypothetical protein
LLEVEGIFAVSQKGLVGLLVVDFRVLTENLGDVGGQGAVHPDGPFGDGALLVEFVNHIEQFLGAAICEGRDQDAAAALERIVQDLLEPGFEVDDRFVLTVTVGAFHDQQIDIAVGLLEVQSSGPAGWACRNGPNLLCRQWSEPSRWIDTSEC